MMFTHVGITEENLSDQGSQFLSGVSWLWSMNQLVTIPYHLMCNGLVCKDSTVHWRWRWNVCVMRSPRIGIHICQDFVRIQRSPTGEFGVLTIWAVLWNNCERSCEHSEGDVDEGEHITRSETYISVCVGVTKPFPEHLWSRETGIKSKSGKAETLLWREESWT